MLERELGGPLVWNFIKRPDLLDLDLIRHAKKDKN